LAFDTRKKSHLTIIKQLSGFVASALAPVAPVAQAVELVFVLKRE